MATKFFIIDDREDRLELIGGVIRHFAKRRGIRLDPSQFMYAQKKDEAMDAIRQLERGKEPDAHSCSLVAFIDICLGRDDDRSGIEAIAALREKLGDRCYIAAVSGVVTASEIGVSPYDRFISLHPQNHNYRTQIEEVLDDAIFAHA